MGIYSFTQRGSKDQYWKLRNVGIERLYAIEDCWPVKKATLKGIKKRKYNGKSLRAQKGLVASELK